MFKYIVGFFLIGFLFLYNFGIFSSLSGSDDQITPIPIVQKAKSILAKDDLANTNDALSRSKNDLPIPKSVKEITISSSDIDRKMKKTPYTYDPNVKTQIPRLTKEEIAAAPIVDVVKMRMNGQNMEMVVVEKDGMTYDASDGVVVFFPGHYGKLFNKYK